MARIAAALPAGGETRWFRAPGRVNLMGDHTDYNEGLVLPVAIDRDCLIGIQARTDGRVRARSLDVQPDDAVAEFAADGSDDPALVEPFWGRFLAGVVRELAGAGRTPVGADAVLSSNVPQGSGLSSSAALEVAFAVGLSAIAGLELPPTDLAAACRRAEHVATGVPVGIMDQLVSLGGRAGAALLIDCRSLETKCIPLPPGIDILAVHSGLPRALAESAYAERRAACQAAAARLGIRALRDASPADVADDTFARHVVSENGRVLQTARALERGAIEDLGPVFAASHASLRDDYRVSTPELDVLVDALIDAGALAARLTGAGFGGCVVALVRSGEAVEIGRAAAPRYEAQTGRQPIVFPCRAVDGAGPVDPRADRTSM